MNRVLKSATGLVLAMSISLGILTTMVGAAAPVATSFGSVNFVSEVPWWQAPHKHVVYPSVFTLSSDVLFDSGSATPSVAAASQLSGVIAAAKAHPTDSLAIFGYTDSKPDPTLPGGNMELSTERAQGIVRLLELAGIAASRITSHGFGEADPVAPNTPNGQPANRRVVITLGAPR